MTDNINRDNSICALAWEHLHVAIDGKVAPCCIWNYKEAENYKLYELSTHTLEEAINSPGMRDMRKAMLSGKRHPLCDTCYRREDENIFTMRELYNEKYLDGAQDIIASTNDDGSIPIEKFKPKYVDVRFSNLCNIKCRMCSHQASSSWYDETKLWFRELDIDKADTIYIDKFESNAESTKEKVAYVFDTVESVYFAGGEPLILNEHYQVLQRIIDSGRANEVNLVYSTNLMVISYKGKSILEYWKHFKDVKVMASIDGMGDVFDYIRTGAKWNTVKKNFEYIRENALDNVKIEICLTVSVQNIYHLPDFIRWCNEHEWLKFGRNWIGVNFVEDPEELDIVYLPTEIKQELTLKYNELFDWLKENRGEDSYHDFISILHHLNGREISQEQKDINLSKLKYRLHAHDRTANLDWQSVLPEIKEVIKKYQSVYWSWQKEPKYADKDR